MKIENCKLKIKVSDHTFSGRRYGGPLTFSGRRYGGPLTFSGRRYGGLLLAVLISLCLGCGSDKPQQTKLLLYCGAGIRPAAAEIAEQFGRQHGVTVECDYAGSEVLISRIKLTGRGDLYMPGDAYYVDQAEQEGLIASKKTACYFVPVILVQKGNPKNIKTIADLTRPGIKVGLGDPEACAIGRKSSKIFAKNDISEDNVNRNVEFRSLTVNELGNHIKLGVLDAVIVWDAVAAYFADDATTVSIPTEQNVMSTVVVGVLSCSEHTESAEKFLKFIASEPGQAIFKKHHYTTTPPE